MLSKHVQLLRRLLLRSRQPDGSLVVPPKDADDMDAVLASFANAANRLEAQFGRRVVPSGDHLAENVVLFPVVARPVPATAPKGGAK